MRKGICLGVFLTFFSGLAFAGDIATERTQWANNGILIAINYLEEQMRAAQEEIEWFERLASETFGEGNELYTWVNDVATELEGVRNLYNDARSVAYTAQNIEARMRDKYKDYEETVNNLIRGKGDITRVNFDAQLRQWSEGFQVTIRNILEAQGAHAEDIATDTGILSFLRGKVETAEGRMQVLHTSQMIMNEQINQMHKLKQIIMEQTNVHAAYFAQKQAREDYQNAATDRMIEPDPSKPAVSGANDAAFQYN